MHELQSWSKAVYITLTYDDKIATPLLSKDELQRYFKRLRKESGLKIKYYACGEYGDDKERAHYHAIIFGIGTSQEDYDLLNECWGLGFIYIRDVNYKACAYVAKYIGKKITGKMAQLKYRGREAPFQLASQGLGLYHALKNKKMYSKNKFMYNQKGKRQKLPRYYIKKLEIDTSELRHKATQGYFDAEMKHSERLGTNDRGLIARSIELSRLQDNLNKAAKLSLNKARRAF